MRSINPPAGVSLGLAIAAILGVILGACPTASAPNPVVPVLVQHAPD